MRYLVAILACVFLGSIQACNKPSDESKDNVAGTPSGTNSDQNAVNSTPLYPSKEDLEKDFIAPIYGYAGTCKGSIVERQKGLNYVEKVAAYECSKTTSNYRRNNVYTRFTPLPSVADVKEILKETSLKKEKIDQFLKNTKDLSLTERELYSSMQSVLETKNVQFNELVRKYDKFNALHETLLSKGHCFDTTDECIEKFSLVLANEEYDKLQELLNLDRETADSFKASINTKITSPFGDNTEPIFNDDRTISQLGNGLGVLQSSLFFTYSVSKKLQKKFGNSNIDAYSSKTKYFNDSVVSKDRVQEAAAAYSGLEKYLSELYEIVEINKIGRISIHFNEKYTNSFRYYIDSDDKSESPFLAYKIKELTITFSSPQSITDSATSPSNVLGFIQQLDTLNQKSQSLGLVVNVAWNKTKPYTSSYLGFGDEQTRALAILFSLMNEKFFSPDAPKNLKGKILSIVDGSSECKGRVIYLNKNESSTVVLKGVINKCLGITE